MPETEIHLQDYNRAVLELVTFPNVLLAWCTFYPPSSTPPPMPNLSQTFPRSPLRIVLQRQMRTQTRTRMTEPHVLGDMSVGRERSR